MSDDYWYRKLHEEWPPQIISFIAEADKLANLKIATTTFPIIETVATPQERATEFCKDLRAQLDKMLVWKGGALRNELQMFIGEFDRNTPLIVDAIFKAGESA